MTDFTGQGKYVCGTWNNPTLSAEEFQAIWEPHTTYGIFQLEDAGTQHFQFYLEMNKLYRKAGLIKVLKGPHYEKRMASTPDAAADYCRKQDDTYVDGPWEWGIMSTGRAGQGQRTDLQEACALLLARGMDAVAAEMPHMYVRFHAGLQALLTRRVPVIRTTDVFIQLRVGPTGTGKTRYFYDNHYGRDGYEVPDGPNLAMNFYENQPVVLIDEYTGRWRLDEFLKIVDRYPRRVNCKYGFCWWYPQVIYITSNLHPRAWYKWEGRETQYDAMMRRFSEVVEFQADGSQAVYKRETDDFDQYARRQY